jgi:hypothetical protein
MRDGTPDDEVTSDEELPVATGGVAAPAPEILGNEDDVDGCELDFTAAEQTNDEELPVHVAFRNQVASIIAGTAPSVCIGGP